mmetsp:Transcript_1139/g.4649  ORF Transcript_1139/g.4649 Transcript_1139/m.4649 type:complete len:568 (-) Transcript_1139:406-2109(-)
MVVELVEGGVGEGRPLPLVAQHLVVVGQRHVELRLPRERLAAHHLGTHGALVGAGEELPGVVTDLDHVGDPNAEGGRAVVPSPLGEVHVLQQRVGAVAVGVGHHGHAVVEGEGPGAGAHPHPREVARALLAVGGLLAVHALEGGLQRLGALVGQEGAALAAPHVQPARLVVVGDIPPGVLQEGQGHGGDHAVRVAVAHHRVPVHHALLPVAARRARAPVVLDLEAVDVRAAEVRGRGGPHLGRDDLAAGDPALDEGAEGGLRGVVGIVLDRAGHDVAGGARGVALVAPPGEGEGGEAHGVDDFVHRHRHLHVEVALGVDLPGAEVDPPRQGAVRGGRRVRARVGDARPRVRDGAVAGRALGAVGASRALRGGHIEHVVRVDHPRAARLGRAVVVLDVLALGVGRKVLLGDVPVDARVGEGRTVVHDLVPHLVVLAPRALLGELERPHHRVAHHEDALQVADGLGHHLRLEEVRLVCGEERDRRGVVERLDADGGGGSAPLECHAPVRVCVPADQLAVVRADLWGGLGEQARDYVGVVRVLVPAPVARGLRGGARVRQHPPRGDLLLA